MKKPNIFLSIGLVIFTIIQLLKHLSLMDFPDFVYGFVLGVAIIFMAAGFIPTSHDFSRLKNIKTNLFKNGGKQVEDYSAY